MDETPVAAPLAPDWPALRGLMPSNVRIGTAVNGQALATNARYRAVLTSDFNAVTAENAMKWGQLQPTRDTYVWRASDDLVAFAQENGLAMYGHTLVWHHSVPPWVSESWSAEELRELLKQYITTVVSRYRGKIWAWDVVNEVLDEDGSLRDTIWLRKLGPDYIADAFRWAHAADPDARLFINDYGAEGRTGKADGLLRLIRKLRATGVPIHGVGFQGHLQWDKQPVDVAGNLQRFADLGIPVAITELDVRIQLPMTPEKLARQAMLYEHMLAACLAVSTCESFTLWGFTDASSWIPHNYPGYGAACLFDTDIRPKLAHSALVRALREGRPGAAGG
ncbi:endo-1,4-beta-xylanase [Micromonospora polyrhachis]|uniref:Beta-xylanase n=1 Tax=Micromonospora polyrhachis TaxID=1282883 RepID=A0A7W7SN39_9ACTN|nr:endo-1,4-beta-xylanase [Micromonospora polyrhachis]MBB4957793.1 endo-1,4-beta-xylanase [Micromonospora polyrhachis]